MEMQEEENEQENVESTCTHLLLYSTHPMLLGPKVKDIINIYFPFFYSNIFFSLHAIIEINHLSRV